MEWDTHIRKRSTSNLCYKSGNKVQPSPKQHGKATQGMGIKTLGGDHHPS